MIVTLLLFMAGLVLLLKGADVAVRGAEGLAVRFGVSAATIGLTVVAFGTSLPEFFVTTEAFSTGNMEIGLANIVGSNIANIGLILAICVLVSPSLTSSVQLRPRFLKDSLLMLAATLLFAVFSLRGVLDWITGIVFLLSFTGFIVYIRNHSRGETSAEPSVVRYPLLQTVAGLLAVLLGSHLLIVSAVGIAELFSIPPYVIGISLVAVGTSLPEFATSVVALLKKSPEISVGNIVGSNIFNILFILGANALVFIIPSPGFSDVLVMTGFAAGIFGLFFGKQWQTRVFALALLVAYGIFIAVLYSAA
ncbi:k+-dependent na+/ca+ exchanger [hydrocarbon metagenome]|uniref:K+-dependent na+/ca+ exchanger n=1 Tax=hydrocarbon metagenome TaxID=938273 RepID=A0A0W8EAQ1_9ZZZZ